MKLLNSILNLCPQSSRRPGKSTPHSIHHIELTFKYREFNDCDLRSANSVYRYCTFTNVTFIDVSESKFDQCEFISCSGNINFYSDSVENINRCTADSKCDIYVKFYAGNANFDINEVSTPQIDSDYLMCDLRIIKDIKKEEIVTAAIDPLDNDCSRFYVDIDRVINYSCVWHFYAPF